MIYGIYAGPPPAAPGLGIEALASADFVNGIYSVAGVSVALGDIVDTPGAITASGLRIDSGAGNGIAIIGDFLQAFIDAAGLQTVVVEWSLDSDGQGPDIFVIQNSGSPNKYIWLYRISFSGDLSLEDRQGGTVVSTDFTGLPNVAGIMRAAYTRASDHAALSVDGATSVVNSYTTGAITPLTAYLGSGNDAQSFMNGYIRKLILYSVLDDSFLPSLSTQ
jgi:hypothetical protein